MEVKKLASDVWRDVLLGDLDGVVDFEAFNLGDSTGERTISSYFSFWSEDFKRNLNIYSMLTMIPRTRISLTNPTIGISRHLPMVKSASTADNILRNLARR